MCVATGLGRPGLKHNLETDSLTFLVLKPSTTTQVPEIGAFKGSVSDTGYVGSSHWSAVMENFRRAFGC
jgi:hypothetical protein